VTAAIFGFVGVLVGGLVTWGIEVWRARHGEQDEARVAARLVADELTRIDVIRMEIPIEAEPQFPKRSVLGAYSALASELSSGHWEEQVTQAYERGLAALEPLMTYKRRHWWQRVFRRG
jgi:hypothetical protein